MVLILSIYKFVIYRLVSHRAFYNRAFHICIAVLPFFISTIILCLQSNLVITLETIGALAIIRFRTAVKDSVLSATTREAGAEKVSIIEYDSEDAL